MNASEVKNNKNYKRSNAHRIEVGQYGQNMYYINTDERVSDSNQDVINAMLLQNQAVGILGGYFDERLTICMISGLAVKIFGYKNLDDFITCTNAQFMNLTVYGEDSEHLINKLSKPQSGVVGYNLKCKNGKAIPFRLGNVVVTSQTGRKMWYLVIRRIGEIYHDSLTGGFNRHGFINCMKNFKESGVALKDYAVISINIKGFKAINDLYGCEFGDALLINAYTHYNGCAFKPIACARLEADKFIMLVNRKNLKFDEFPNVMKIPYTYGDKRYYVNCIFGIYYIEDDRISFSKMIDNALLAKEKVQDVFVKPYMIYERTMNTDHIIRTVALSQFDDALSKNEFKIYYQPVIDCKTNDVVSAEALIRWNKQNSVLSPGMFIPAFEENGCIVKLDEYVLTYVIRRLRDKAKCGQPIVPISVNLSRMDFFDTERTDKLYQVFKCDPFVRKYVHFEITETSYLSVKEKQAEFINNINDLGGVVYIDDFGTVNSSMDMLIQYDFGVLKLDMRFIRAMAQDEKARVLVGVSIRAAHELNMKVVAEGVETEDQLKLLKDMDCDYIQGYYFSKPLDEDGFAKYLERHKIVKTKKG